MPFIKYADWRPQAAAAALVATANEILDEYSGMGYQLTLRQLYYQFIARDIFPNTEKSYSRLGDIVSSARDAGLIDWDMIADRGRTADVRHDFGSLRSFVYNAAASFTLDLWEGQRQRVEVWVEKDALSQIVEKAARPYGVTTFANKGYVSSSAMWQAAQRLLDLPGEVEHVVILHFGDHDPSGIDMTRDIERRLQLYMDGKDDTGATAIGPFQTFKEITVVRCALNMKQVEALNPPPNPAKVTDSRFKDYQDKFGDECWELDAIPPEELEEIIVDNIEDYADMVELNKRKNFEAAERQRLLDKFEDERH